MKQAAFCIIQNDDKVLLVQSLTNPRHIGEWSLPGGLVDPGESPDQSAAREAVEEVAISCTINELLAEVDNSEDGVHAFIYTANYVSGEIKIDSSELKDAQWFDIHHALKLPLAYHIEDHLRQIIDSIK